MQKMLSNESNASKGMNIKAVIIIVCSCLGIILSYAKQLDSSRKMLKTSLDICVEAQNQMIEAYHLVDSLKYELKKYDDE